MKLARAVLWLLVLLQVGCQSPAATPAPLPIATFPLAQPTLDPGTIPQSNGGEPRSTGYWLTWNSCAENNQAETARANGGREAGWILMDDLLADPGMLVGKLQVVSCEQGVNLLQARDLQSAEMKNDPAYTLASQLLAAQLNLATGSEYCPASDQVVSKAQFLLLQLKFDGTGSYLGLPVLNEQVEAARKLEDQLTQYNAGSLCLP